MVDGCGANSTHGDPRTEAGTRIPARTNTDEGSRLSYTHPRFCLVRVRVPCFARCEQTSMSIFRVKTTEARVGVVGLYSAGKTVLLTSLINHLQDHDPDRFPLGAPGTRLRKFTVHAPDSGWAAFNYTGYRDALVNAGRWPSKTTDRSQ